MKCTHLHMTHSDIINLWPSLSQFADDLGVRYGTAKAMRRRGRIPSEYWFRLAQKAEERGMAGATIDVLAAAVALEAAE